MSIEDAVRKRGFRQWYERQLIEGHAYLVTGLLSLLMTALALETIEFRASIVNSIALALVAAIGGWLSLFAWKQFTKLLSCAQALAEQAVCGECRDVRQVRCRRGVRFPPGADRPFARRPLPEVPAQVADGVMSNWGPDVLLARGALEEAAMHIPPWRWGYRVADSPATL